MYDQISRLCLSYFLCEFDPGSRKRRTVDVIREVALATFSEDVVDAFVDNRLTAFQQTLVEEFNSRYADDRPLRFQIADDVSEGSVVVGFQRKSSKKEIDFQDQLNKIRPREFEMLAAIILQVLGCKEVYATPESHDQGIDAFGLLDIVQETPYGVIHRLTWIAQAKHYRASVIATADVRELIGSRELLIARVFSTVDERYEELRLRPYAPTAVALITTEEIPRTVRRLAERSGVFVFAASDLYQILGPLITKKSAAGLRTLIKRREKTITILQ